MGRNLTNKPQTHGSRKGVILLCGVVLLGGLLVRLANHGDGPPAVEASIATPGDPAGTAAPVRMLPPMHINWQPTLERDLFSTEFVLPPPPAPETRPTTQAAQTRPAPLTQPAGPDPAELRRLATAAAVADAKANIHLSSTLVGAEPIALINDRTCRVNDKVAGFMIVAIEERRIVIERNGIRLAIISE
jgi:hypothetical protein